MKPDLNFLFVGLSLIAACVLFVQVHAVNLFQTLAGSDFSWEAQSERERTYLLRYLPDDRIPGVGQSPTETLSLVDPFAFAWRTAFDEAEQHRPRIPADPLFASDLDTRNSVTVAGQGDAQ